MNIVLSVSGHIITAISAFIAIQGKTWSGEKKGFKKLTITGRIAATTAVIGLSLSVYQSIEKHNVAQDYKTYAMQNIEKGWSNLFVPFEALYFQITEEKVAKGAHVQFAKELLTNNMLLEFDKLNFNEVHKFRKFGKLGYMICSQTLSGMGLMLEKVDKYSNYIDLDIKKKVEELQKSGVFSSLIRFGGCPSIMGASANSPEKYKGIFNTDKMRNYLTKLIELEKLFK